MGTIIRSKSTKREKGKVKLNFVVGFEETK